MHQKTPVKFNSLSRATPLLLDFFVYYIEPSPPLGPTAALLRSTCSFYVGFLYRRMQITTCHIQSQRHGKKKNKDFGKVYNSVWRKNNVKQMRS